MRRTTDIRVSLFCCDVESEWSNCTTVSFGQRYPSKSEQTPTFRFAAGHRFSSWDTSFLCRQLRVSVQIRTSVMDGRGFSGRIRVSPVVNYAFLCTLEHISLVCFRPLSRFSLYKCIFYFNITQSFVQCRSSPCWTFRRQAIHLGSCVRKGRVLHYREEKRFTLYVVLLRHNGKLIFLFRWEDIARFLCLPVSPLDLIEKRIVWGDISGKFEDLFAPTNWKSDDMLIDKLILYEVCHTSNQ
jgi:hypothetical protein